MFGFGKKREPKKLKFKQGDMALMKISNSKGIITRVYPGICSWDYKFEWLNHITGKPERVNLREFEIKKVKQ